MNLKLTRIDELIRPEHAFLEATDRCFFLREYTAGAGYKGETNNLILNLKKKPDRRDKPEWKHKLRAIEQAGRELRQAIGERGLRSVTIVPVPPSKCRTNSTYDDRVLQIALEMTKGLSCDIRELVQQKVDMPAAHESSVRAKPYDYFHNYYLDEALCHPEPTRLLVLDDVLTAGAHFAAMKKKLVERFPAVNLFGCFYARRAVPKAVDNLDDY